MKLRLRCPKCNELRLPDFQRVGPLHCSCGWTMTGIDGTGYWRDNRDTPKNILSLGSVYIVAWRRWQAAGRPYRSDEEVERITAICHGCSKYRDGRCEYCGCSIDAQSWLGDKPTWATESCPLDKW